MARWKWELQHESKQFCLRTEYVCSMYRLYVWIYMSQRAHSDIRIDRSFFLKPLTILKMSFYWSDSVDWSLQTNNGNWNCFSKFLLSKNLRAPERWVKLTEVYYTCAQEESVTNGQTHILTVPPEVLRQEHLYIFFYLHILVPHNNDT